MYDCRRLGAWGDICTYRNMCYDGKVFYFLSKGGCGVDALDNCGVWYEDADLKEGLIYPSYPVKPVDKNTRFPFNGGACIGKRVDPSALSSPTLNITWTDRVMWRLPFHFPLDNIWFISSRSMPIYKVSILPSRKLHLCGV